MLSDVLEGEAAARGEILDGARDKDIGRASHRGDPSADRHGQPGVLALDDLALAGVDSRADLDVQLAHATRDLDGAWDGAGGAIEGGIEAVARRIVLNTRQRSSASRTTAL